jgi:hypothetical protein
MVLAPLEAGDVVLAYGLICVASIRIAVFSGVMLLRIGEPAAAEACRRGHARVA